jgi:nitrite reductase (NADH) small subunit
MTNLEQAALTFERVLLGGHAMNSDIDGWCPIGTLHEIPPRGSRCLQTALGRIAVFRTIDDRVFAIEDRCPHRGGPLSQGIVHGSAVTCPLHNWVIDLESGEAQGADSGRVRTFALRVDGERLLMRSEDLAAAVGIAA